MTRIAFRASSSPTAQQAYQRLIAAHGQATLAEAEVIVALGGDGFMLQTLHEVQASGLAVYGMNCGTVGFLMNAYAPEGLIARLRLAEEISLNPLHMTARDGEGRVTEALSINEVSLLRMGGQAAKLRILVDGVVRLPELICDGCLLATPAGSTAYNCSANGPILPIGSDVLALTSVAAFRPRRWRGALLPKSAVVRFEVLDPEKRPVRADADTMPVSDVRSVEIRSEPGISHRILFDPGHGLEERLLNEQFA
jgi:NAD+ kinase